MLGKVRGFFKVKRNIGIVAVVVLVVLFFGRGAAVQRAEKKAAEEAAEQAEQEQLESENNVDNSDETVGDDEDGFGDAYLKEQQPDLIRTYGRLPEGYMWDLGGNMFSLGDKSMSAEEVVYAYMSGIRTLDLSMAQKYSRDSFVVEEYSNFFDKDSALESDYYDSFIRSMFKECLLSIEVEGVSDSAVFTENKQVYTVNARMIDLADKDFWLDDKEKIYDNLYLYSSDEEDSTKGEMYLYDYVLRHYQSKDAKTREISFDITVEKYPDLDTGWLVSIDKDIYDACMYTDGTLMVNYMQEQFLKEGLQPRIQKEVEEAEEDMDDIDDARAVTEEE